MKVKHIHYDVAVNMVRDVVRQTNWETRFTNLTESDMRTVAGWYNIAPKRIDKLVNHTSSKFIYMANRKASITKRISTEASEYIALDYWTKLHTQQALDILKSRSPELK
jgi:hypothetical protein